MISNHISSETLPQPQVAIIAEGKTKIIVARVGDIENVDIISKNDITAGDGAKHDIILGKAALATQTTCNVFRLLQTCGIPVAFNEQINETTFSAPLCSMLPCEVVVRREAHGSYLKRMPGLPKGHLFPRLLTEFFLKTNGRKWRKHRLLCDDPLLNFGDHGEILLFDPSKPIHGQKQFLTLNSDEVFTHADERKFFAIMEKIAKRVFLVLEKSWQLEGRTLVDFKVEFGLTKDGTLLLADVIDNDSWRVVENGMYIDKQAYCDGAGLDDVVEKYRRVATITGHFHLPVQQLIIWRGSGQDDVSEIVSTLDQLCKDYPQAASQSLRISTSTCSIHREPVRGLNELHRLVQEVPDAVVIAHIGRSNAAGPTLSASTTVPVITVPANFKSFPDDIWSSLRTPLNVPVTTILDPSNAALAAVGILALRNPFLYMFLRERVEERLVNTIAI